MIYLDQAATSFPKPPEVIKAVTEALSVPASPGRSGHSASINALRAIHQARKNMSKLFGIKDNTRLIFTHNVTWALNMVLEGLELKAGDHVLSSAMEHNAVARPLHRLARERGIIWEIVPVDGQGLTDPDEFRKKLKPGTRLVALNHASNVTGAIAPAKEIKEAIGEVPLLLDCAQTAGTLPMDEYASFIDIIAFTGHKALLGPTGTGGFWIRPGLNLRPLALGGTGSRSESLEAPNFPPDAYEAGTGNTHGLAGLAAGAEFVLKTGADNIFCHEQKLVSQFLTGLDKLPGLKILGPQKASQRVAVISIIMKNQSSSGLATALEREFDILTRAGLQCAPLAHQHLGSFPYGSTRFSFGYFNTSDDVSAAVEALTRLA